MRSAAFGIWVAVGSRDERPSIHGASHFLEHLLFKGTKRRDALEISSVMDAVGGEMNAFTAKEYTCYYARVLDEDLPLAVDVVSDLVLSSVVTSDDVEVERGVILEEIAMHDDEPGDAVHDALAGALWGDSPLGRPVIGTVDSIESLTRPAIAGFYRRRYDLPHMVVAAAGSVDHDVLLGLVEQAFAERLTGDAAPASLRPTGPAPRAGRASSCRSAPTEQAHVVLGTTRLRRDDPRRFALSVLSGRWAAACRAGCSRRCARSAGWPTPSTPTPTRTPTPACSASTPAARRARSARCSTSCAPSSPPSPSTASPTRRCAGRRAACAARWCSASRTAARA
jgi:predicted Zn-dependent peptidase